MFFLCFVATLNAPVKKPIVIDGEIVVKKLAKLNLWFDHRYADGADVAHHIPKFREVMDNPDKFLMTP